MSPPSFADLGKTARDLFSKGYHFGLYKVDLKSKTSNGVELSTTGQSSHDNGLFFGILEAKYKWQDYGITLKDTWTTDNVLSADLSVEDQIVKGLKFGVEAKLAASSGKKSAKVKTSFHQDKSHTTLDYDVNTSTLLGSVVIGHQGFLGGVQLAYDVRQSDKTLLSQSQLVAGYSLDDIDFHIALKGGKDFVGSVFHRVNRDLESGIQVGWASDSNETSFGFGSKYTVDKDLVLRAKLDNACRVGLSFQQKLRPGVTLTLSTLLEGKSMSAGGHKVGVNLEFEA